MKKIRFLAVQYKIRYLDIEANINKFERILRKHIGMKPDLVIFPEYALTGPLYSHYDFTINGKTMILKKISALARKYNTYIIPGSFIRKVGNGLFNSTCIVSPRVGLLDYYDKQCLWSTERLFLKKGTKSKIFKTELGSIVLQICADLHSSLISHQYRQLKPNIIINIAMWSREDIKACCKKVPPEIELQQIKSLTQARAIENRSFMIFCNYGGGLKIQAKTGRIYSETSIGNTMVINPFGEIIAKASTNKEEVIFQEIDISTSHWSKYEY